MSDDSPRAGWYRDPAGGDDLRWWDGSRWTEAVRAHDLDDAEDQIQDHDPVSSAGPKSETANQARSDPSSEPTRRERPSASSQSSGPTVAEPRSASRAASAWLQPTGRRRSLYGVLVVLLLLGASVVVQRQLGTSREAFAQVAAERESLVELPNGATLSLPSGAVSGPGTAHLRGLKEHEDQGLPGHPIARPVGDAIEASLRGAQLTGPVTLSVPFDLETTSEETVFLAYLRESDGVWVPVEGKVDLEERYVQAAANHLSIWRVFAGMTEDFLETFEPLWELVDSPPPPSPTCEPGLEGVTVVDEGELHACASWPAVTDPVTVKITNTQDFSIDLTVPSDAELTGLNHPQLTKELQAQLQQFILDRMDAELLILPPGTTATFSSAVQSSASQQLIFSASTSEEGVWMAVALYAFVLIAADLDADMEWHLLDYLECAEGGADLSGMALLAKVVDCLTILGEAALSLASTPLSLLHEQFGAFLASNREWQTEVVVAVDSFQPQPGFTEQLEDELSPSEYASDPDASATTEPDPTDEETEEPISQDPTVSSSPTSEPTATDSEPCEPNDGTTRVHPSLSSGDVQRATIAPPCESDVWPFDGSAGDAVNVILDYGEDNLQLTLYGPSGQRVATGNLGCAYGPQYISAAELPETGRYEIEVQPCYTTDTATYSVELQIKGSPRTLSAGQPVSDTIELAGDYHDWELNVTAGQTIEAYLDYGQVSFDIRIYDPSGMEVARGQLGCAYGPQSTDPVTASASGDYLIRVSSCHTDENASYTLTATLD